MSAPGTAAGPLEPLGARPDDAERLVAIALEAMEARLDGRQRAPAANAALPTALRAPGATFVTLERDGRLLGCIGSLEPRRPLADDVAHNAEAAAFADPRLPAITHDDFARMSVKISVLGPLHPLDVTGVADLARQVEPGRDGVLIEATGHRATFLPAVWDKLPRVDTFLSQLWRKAGMRPFVWPPDLRAATYRVTEIVDEGPRRTGERALHS